jgi:hypothetical protein
MLSNEELKAKLQIGQDAKLRRWLQENRVPWTTDGQGRPITSESLLSEAIRQKSQGEVVF